MTTKLPLTPKVGEVPLDQDKFASWSGNHGYYPREPINQSNFRTEKDITGKFSTADLIENKLLVTKMFTKNKASVEFKGKTLNGSGGGGSSGFLNTTTAPSSSTLALQTNTFTKTIQQNHFVNAHQSLKTFQTIGTLDNFEKSFQKFIKLKPSNSLKPEAENNPIASLFDVDLIVKDCLGEDISEFIIEKFKDFANSIAKHGEIYWKDFISVIEKVYKAIESECAIHHDLPPLVLLMNKPREFDPNLGSVGDSSTTYRDNFNGNHKFQFNNTSPKGLHYSTPKQEIGSDLNNSAKILCAGTTKGTHHLPGYRGHIPTNVRNQKKAEHASGNVPHPVVNDLILTQRGMGCVLNYTGKPYLLSSLLCLSYLL